VHLKLKSSNHSSPIAMDLEWRVDFFRKPGTNSNAQRERKTAVVQIADGGGLILVIQINNMRSEYSRCLSRKFLINHFTGFPIRLQVRVAV
jgi:hypothetical protein